MNFDFTVNPEMFEALLNVDVEKLGRFSIRQMRPILPCLVRMSLIAPARELKRSNENRKGILVFLTSMDAVNNIVNLLATDFNRLESHVKKEQKLRQKNRNSESILVPASACGNENLGVLFEKTGTSSVSRLKLVLRELLAIVSEVQEIQKNSSEFYIKDSDLFDNAVYLPEICDTINISLAELPTVLSYTDVCHSLLHVRHGSEMICWIVANFPEIFYHVCFHLISTWERAEDENGGTAVRVETLVKLCKMNPKSAFVLRSKCVESCKLLSLAIILTLDFQQSQEYKSDLVPFIMGLLLGSEQVVRNWFTALVRCKPKKIKEEFDALERLRVELMNQLKDVVGDSCSHIVRGSALMRLYCALRGIAGAQLNEEEVSLLVKLMTSHVPATPEGVRFVSIAVCMLFACPVVIGEQENDAKCMKWLKRLSADDSPFFGKPNDVTSSFSEMLLLLAIHVHSGQTTAIIDLVCSTLGMKVSIRTNNAAANRVKHIFTTEVFTEQVVTSRAINMLVTKNLNAKMQGFLPIHCIYQLMKSKSLSKYKVNAKNWIYKQICCSTSPLHPLLPALIDVYVNSMLQCSSNRPPYEGIINEPLEEEEIIRVFNDSFFLANEVKGGGDCCIMPHMLLLYYMLCYEDVRMANAQHFAAVGKKIKSYSAEFLSEFPIKYLLQQAIQDQHFYSGLYSPLLRLVYNHFPHLVLVQDWIDEDEIATSSASQGPLSISDLDRGLGCLSESPWQTSHVLCALLNTPLTKIWPYAETFMKHLRSSLDDSVPRYIQILYRQVWLKLNSVLPRNLWIMTIKALLHKEALLPSVPSKQQKIIIDPLQVIRCDFRVFRSAEILKIVLRVLQSSLAASKSQLSKHRSAGEPLPIHANVIGNGGLGQTGGCKEVEEMRAALVAAQESAALQILLEVCLEQPSDCNSQAGKWALCEVRSLVCSFLHQAFIADRSICRLVHFEGYPHELLPIAVSGIPSMHICLEFLPALMCQPSVEKQAFAVDLLSHLSLQFALPRFMNASKLILDFLATLLPVLSSPCRMELFSKVLPALVRTCQAFPPFAESVALFLLQLGRITASENATKLGRFSSLHSPHWNTLHPRLHKLTINVGKKPDQNENFTNSDWNHRKPTNNGKFMREIENTFLAVVSNAAIKKRIY